MKVRKKQLLLAAGIIWGFAGINNLMSFGIGIRMSGIWPDSWIAVFYTGLGTALFLAGTGFISRYIKVHSLGRRSAAAEM